MWVLRGSGLYKDSAILTFMKILIAILVLIGAGAYLVPYIKSDHQALEPQRPTEVVQTEMLLEEAQEEEKTAIPSDAIVLVTRDVGRFQVSKDSEHLYVSGFGGEIKEVSSEGVDLQSLSYIEGTSMMAGRQYFKDKARVYYIDYDSTGYKLITVEGADPGSFKAYDYGFLATDANRIYFMGAPFGSVSPSNFKIIGKQGRYEEPATADYFVADGRFYIVPDASKSVAVDVDTFVQIKEYEPFFKDKNRVYYRLDILEDADPKTVRVEPSDDDLGRGVTYVISSSAVYADTEKVTKADPETFSAVGYSYAKDKNFVYRGTDVVPGEDPLSFTLQRAAWLHHNN